MLDLDLTAALFRAILWPTVQRLILVGDPNQLPPIGPGRFFADIINFIQKEAPQNVATLEINLRQLEGRVLDGATGIIDLAKCYLSSLQRGVKVEDATTAAEQMLQKVQIGGNITPDLQVLYWQEQKELSQMLLDQMAADLTGRGENPANEFSQLWRQAHENNSKPAYFQVLSPYRGEFFGTEEFNRVCQEHILGARPGGNNSLGSIMLFDKVIQVRNRPRSWPI